MSTILNLFVLVTLPILAVFALFKNRKNKANVIFALFIFCVTFWIFTNLMVDLSQSIFFLLFWSKLTLVGIILFTALFWKFSVSFPRPLRYNIIYEFLIWGSATILLLLVPTKYNIRDVELVTNGVPVVHPGELYILFSVYLIIVMFLGLMNLVKSYRSSIGISKQQVKYVIIGVILSIIGAGTTNLILLIFGFSEFANLGPIFLLFFIVLTTYAIARYRLLDIRLIIFRSLAFGSLVLLITITFATISGLIATLFQDLLGFKSNLIAGLVVGILVSITYQPLRRSIEGITNQFLYKKSYNPDQLLSQISEVTASILDLHNLLDSICATLDEAFHTQKIGIALLNPKQKLEVAFQKGFAPGSAEALVSYPKVVPTLYQELKNIGGTLVIDEMKTRYENGEFKPVDSQLLLALYENDIALILPLYVKEQLIGIIALGNKKSGDPYNHQDLSILKIIAGQIAIAIENARLYDELKDFNVKLEEEVRRKTTQLRKANQELRQLDQAKSEFISIASHQLRTPLTVIKGYISMMREGSFGPVSPTIMNNLEKVYASNERLIGLVENLLDISRIESGRQEFEWKKVRLEDIAQTVVDNLKNTAKLKNLKLVFNKPKVPTPEIMADPNKIHEVMMNFVDNAIKYTKEGKIDVSVLVKPEGKITFSVEDTGMGISPDIKPFLFQKFSRGKGSFRVHTEGVGLGLYVAKMIIDAHDGKAWAESEGPGKGSKFSFSLPLKNDKIKPAGQILAGRK